MGWIEGIGSALDYIEENLACDAAVEEAARRANVSPFYFQKAFSMLCGFTVGEYVRRRRLSLAGSELLSTDARIIDLALKYGYDSPDSFTKAFTRFHGVTPIAARRGEAALRAFAPLKINFSLKGGNIMDYKIIDKEAFTVLGVSRTYKYEEAMEAVPKLWAEHYQTGKGEIVCGMYGVNMDERMGGKEFEYIIADDYTPGREVPEGFVTKVIPAFTWAIFSCHGPMPTALQSANKQIYSEWLPNNRDYEIAAGYFIEMYEDPAKYPKGTMDENYYCEAWIPVKKK